MKLRSPFEWLCVPVQKAAFIALLVLTLFVGMCLSVLGKPLNTDPAPHGIISFELAGNLACAQRILASWGDTGKVSAGLNLGLDYLFLVAYSGCISLGCVLAARGFSRRIRSLSVVGLVLGWIQYGAALLDAAENYALIRVLLGSKREIWPVVARWCAIPKFLIVAVGIVFVVVGAIIAMAVRPRGTEPLTPHP
jgi:hypothetical protein